MRVRKKVSKQKSEAVDGGYDVLAGGASGPWHTRLGIVGAHISNTGRGG